MYGIHMGYREGVASIWRVLFAIKALLSLVTALSEFIRTNTERIFKLKRRKFVSLKIPNAIFVY